MSKKFSLAHFSYLVLTFSLMLFFRVALDPLDLLDSPVALDPR